MVCGSHDVGRGGSLNLSALDGGNGFVINGIIRTGSAISRSDVSEGWRDRRKDGCMRASRTRFTDRGGLAAASRFRPAGSGRMLDNVQVVNALREMLRLKRAIITSF